MTMAAMMLPLFPDELDEPLTILDSLSAQAGDTFSLPTESLRESEPLDDRHVRQAAALAQIVRSGAFVARMVRPFCS